MTVQVTRGDLAKLGIWDECAGHFKSLLTSGNCMMGSLIICLDNWSTTERHRMMVS